MNNCTTVPYTIGVILTIFIIASIITTICVLVKKARRKGRNHRNKKRL